MPKVKRISECTLFALAMIIAAVNMNPLEFYFVLLPFLTFQRPKESSHD